MRMQDIIEQHEDDVYYDKKIRSVIEDHLNIIIAHSSLQEIEPAMAYKYHGNFYGLLAENGKVDLGQFWLYLRVNGFTHPSEWSMEMNTIRVPNLELVNRIIQRALID